MHTTQRQMSRALAAGALSLALLSAGSAGAFAAETKPKPSPSPMSPSPMSSITVKASRPSVMTNEPVTFTGRTAGLKVGWPLVLQHQTSGGKWVPLKVKTKIKNGSSYALTTAFKTKGTEHLRVAAVGKKVYSPTVTVDVT
ncbi:hypothetical protein [Streptomyces sasae]|uniref:hypothetical protein n=1 Tax=Streptomyces sasae TaxID=1266772 RepID=UPI002930A094|nr:hypothetical protein [Streptomyces sasae]